MSDLSRSQAAAPPEMCAAILALAPKHIAVPNAPSSKAELEATRGARVRKVWDGASDRTIFPTTRLNYAFRAWHDACHLEGNYDFTLSGEMEVCALQAAQLRMAMHEFPPTLIAHCIAILEAEVIGQARYFERNGQFPVDQRSFCVAYMVDQQIALERVF